LAKLILRNAEVFTGERFLGPRDICIEDGLITNISQPTLLSCEGAHEYDLNGMWLLPALCDLHAHLREPGFPTKETIATGLAAAAMGGFGAVVTMPNTEPPCDSIEMMHRQLVLRDKAIAAAGKPLPTLIPSCAMTKDRAGHEPTDFAGPIAEGCIVFTDDGSDVDDDVVLREVMEAIAKAQGNNGSAVPRLMFHAQKRSLMCSGVMHEGMVSLRLGLPGIPRESEDEAVERAIAFGLEYKAPVHITHVTTAGAIEIIKSGKAKYAELKLEGMLTCDVTPHHLTFTEEDVARLGALAKCNPPLREATDRDALRAGLLDGTIDCIATDHAPHTAGEKSQDLLDAPFGIAGLEAALGASLNAMGGGMENAARVLHALTSAPAKLIGAQQSAGVLAEGSAANVCIYDPAEEWRVDPSQFAGKCKVSPYAGMVLRGRLKAVILSGALAWGTLPGGAKGAV
jgi:dihydroorotase